MLTIVQNKRTNEKVKEFRYGSLIALEGILSTPISSRNPGEFSYRDYLELNNIFATVHVLGYSEVHVISEVTPNPFFEYVIFPSKHFIHRVITTAMSGDEANFMLGLLLGDRTDLSADIKSAFVNTGTIHVLIVAGMRVALIAAIMYTLFGLLRLPEREKSIAAIVGILYYMELTGAAPPVLRASLMAITVLLAKLFQERTNVYNSLGVSAVIILTYDPMQLFDAGFQLSVLRRVCDRLFLSEVDRAYKKNSGKSRRGQSNRLCVEIAGGVPRRSTRGDSFHRIFFRKGIAHFPGRKPCGRADC